MKTKAMATTVLLALLALNSRLSTVVAQGSLTPPGTPAPTMKTLAQIEPRIPISSLPITITNPGSYYLTTNLTGVGGGLDGITVRSGNVAIDLSGFTLQGVSGSGTGIHVPITVTNLVFRNGTITGWGNHGIDTYSVGSPRNQLFEQLTVSGNAVNGIFVEAGSIVRDCAAYGNGQIGIYSLGGEISGCISRNNGSSGFAVASCSLVHCSAQYNGSSGFYINAGRALDCDCLYNSGYGFDCYGTGDEIRRCRTANNNNDGIVVEAGAIGTVIDDCEIADNNGFALYSFGGASGTYIVRNNFISPNNSCLYLHDDNNYIEGNHVLTTPGSSGIFTAGTNNVVVKNVVVGGAPNNYIPAGNDYGPVDSASTATSPWANISH